MKLNKVYLKQRKVGQATAIFNEHCFSPHSAQRSSELCVITYSTLRPWGRKKKSFSSSEMRPLGCWSLVCIFEDSIRSPNPPSQLLVSSQSAPVGTRLSLYRWAGYTLLTVCFRPALFSPSPSRQESTVYIVTWSVAVWLQKKLPRCHSILIDISIFFFSLFRQSPVSPTSRRRWGPCCLPTTQRATGTTWTASGWSSPSPAPEFTWRSTTLTWSLPTTSSPSETATSRGPRWWAASLVPRFPLTSRPTATSCSWSFRPITPCLAEDSTSPTAVRTCLIYLSSLFFMWNVLSINMFSAMGVVMGCMSFGGSLLCEGLHSSPSALWSPLFSLLAQANWLHCVWSWSAFTKQCAWFLRPHATPL